VLQAGLCDSAHVQPQVVRQSRNSGERSIVHRKIVHIFERGGDQLHHVAGTGVCDAPGTMA